MIGWSVDFSLIILCGVFPKVVTDCIKHLVYMFLTNFSCGSIHDKQSYVLFDVGVCSGWGIFNHLPW